MSCLKDLCIFQDIKGNQDRPDTSQSVMQPFHEGIANHKRKNHSQNIITCGYKRALYNPKPLYIPDSLLTSTLKDIVGQIHGDFGRASVTTGIITRLCPV